MRSLQALKRDAAESAKFRGHELEWHDNDDISSLGSCKHCPMWVQVIRKPAPNEIDIGGPAVARECTKETVGERSDA